MLLSSDSSVSITCVTQKHTMGSNLAAVGTNTLRWECQHDATHLRFLPRKPMIEQITFRMTDVPFISSSGNFKIRGQCWICTLSCSWPAIS